MNLSLFKSVKNSFETPLVVTSLLAAILWSPFSQSGFLNIKKHQVI